jgi:hypothetical protein
MAEGVRGWVRDTVGWRHGMSVRMPANTVHLMTAGIVRVVATGMTARKTEKRHCGHAGGSEHDAEDVKVHGEMECGPEVLVAARNLSHYYTDIVSRSCAMLLRFAAAGLVACHSTPVTESPAAENPGEIAIHVVNRNRIDVVVYVGHDGVRNRLGLATASTTTDFNLSLRVLGAGHEYRLLGDPLGVRITITTETLFARPGDEVTWQLEDSFARSTVVVH